jgi:hypothetical protein
LIQESLQKDNELDLRGGVSEAKTGRAVPQFSDLRRYDTITSQSPRRERSKPLLIPFGGFTARRLIKICGVLGEIWLRKEITGPPTESEVPITITRSQSSLSVSRDFNKLFSKTSPKNIIHGF